MKRILSSMILLLALVYKAEAQVILLESDENRSRVEVEGTPPFIPVLGVTYDQYAPISEGVSLLCCLGAVYLLKKKRKMK